MDKYIFRFLHQRLKPTRTALVFLAMMLFSTPALGALDITAQINPDAVEAGERLAVKFTVSNTDGFTRSDVTITMEYPAGLTSLFHSAISDGGTCAATVSNNNACDATEILTWNIGDVAANSSVSVDMPPMVLGTTVAGTSITFAPEVSDIGGAAGSVSESTVVTDDRSLELTLLELTADPIAANSEITYVLNYGYSALSSSASNTVLELPLPSGLSFVSASDGGNFAANTVTWNIGTMNPGDGGERRATFLVSNALINGSIIDAEASISDQSGEQTLAALGTTVSDQGGLKVVLNANPNPAQPSDTTDIAITVSNTSSFDRSGVTVQMRYPENLNDLSIFAISDGGVCTASVSNNNACDSSEYLTWNLGTVAANSTVVVDMPPVISSATDGGTLIPFTVVARDNFANIAVTASDTVRVVDERELTLALFELSNDPVVAGSQLTYVLSYGHQALSSVALGTTMTLEIPAGLNFVEADGGGAVVDGQVQWALGTLSPGDGGERRAVFTVDNGMPVGETIEIKAIISDTSSDIAKAEETSSITDSTPLTLTIDANPNPAQPGDVLDVKILVANSSAFERSGVVLSMRYPLGLADLTHFGISNGGTCFASVSNNNACDSTELLTWNIGTLAPGSSITVDMPPIINTTALPGSTIVFDAQVTDSFAEVSTFASEGVLIAQERSLVLAINESNPVPVLPGNDLEYVLTYGYRALSTVAINSMIELPVPTGLTFVSADGGGVLAGDVVQWSLGTLVPGQSGERAVRFALDSQASIGTSLKLEATLFDNGADIARADAVTAIENDIPLSVAIDVNATPAEAGERLHLKLTINNTSPFDRSGVTLKMRFPEGLDDVSHGLITDGGTCLASVSNNNACDSREVLTWNLGTIAAGSGVSVSMPVRTIADLAAGEVISFVAEVEDNFADVVANATETLRIKDDRVLELAINETGVDPVSAMEQVSYSLTFGQSSLSSLSQAVSLSMRIPEGLSFVSATGGGVELGGSVQWSIGTMQSGEVSERRATFAVDGALALGSSFKAEAIIVDNAGNETRADTITRKESFAPLRASLSVVNNPALPGDTLNVGLTVDNTSPFNRANVMLRLRFPFDFNALAHSDISDGGICPATVSNNNACDAREVVTWNLGTLLANSSQSVSLPPVIAAALGQGRLLELQGQVEDATARSDVEFSLKVGVPLDTDGDGIADSLDNCMTVPNADQRDTNGDGFGNQCDPDLNNDGIVNFSDIAMWAPFFGTANSGDVDFNGDGFANFIDFALFSNYFLQNPGPSGFAP